MNRLFTVVCFLCYGLGVFAQQSLSDDEKLVFKQKVREKAKTTKTIKSDFTQKKHLSFLKNDIVSSGTFYFKQPNVVKWYYMKPFDYSIVFKNNKMLINDNGKKTTVNTGNNKLFKNLNHLITNTATGELFDEENFHISFIKNDKQFIVTLRPKDVELKKYIAQFELYFGIKNYVVEQVKMIEPANDFTLITFKNRQENTPLKDEVFTN
ncbi:MAG: cell envelope biogenesis protein LolA [Flavobacteriales bacterium]|nr:MAG: cell envelope biogenesis protein LolA [Flavobacteriales bacterium]